MLEMFLKWSTKLRLILIKNQKNVGNPFRKQNIFNETDLRHEGSESQVFCRLLHSQTELIQLFE